MSKSNNIKQQLDEFKTKYPKFSIDKNNDKYTVSGLLEINEFGDYEIQIDIPFDYPKAHPIIREIGNDIPKVNDRHINEDGTCCIAIKYEISKYLQEDTSIINFVEKYVKPFFANQLYYTNKGKWINGEYSHGIQGVIEYLYEELLLDKSLIKTLLPSARSSLVNWNKKCPCGSMKSTKKCHMSDILKIKRIINS